MVDTGLGLIAVGAGIAVGLAGIGTGMAQKDIGAAAVGAITEEYWRFSFSISPSNEYSGLISFRIDWFNLLAVQGTLKSLLQLP